MRFFSLFIILPLTLYSQSCKELHNQSNQRYAKLNTLLKENVASKTAYTMINEYINIASLTIAECSLGEDRLSVDELNTLKSDIKRFDKEREHFKIATIDELKKEIQEGYNCPPSITTTTVYSAPPAIATPPAEESSTGFSISPYSTPVKRRF